MYRDPLQSRYTLRGGSTKGVQRVYLDIHPTYTPGATGVYFGCNVHILHPEYTRVYFGCTLGTGCT